MNESIILETPFLTQIYPFKITNKGIYPSKFSNLCFKFVLPPITKDVNTIQENEIFSINMIKRREKVVYFLQMEFYHIKL